MTEITMLRERVSAEVKQYLAEELGKKDFIAMVKLIRGFPYQYRKTLTDFACALGKTQNPRFDEARFRDAVFTDKPV